jgi:hypothetical protein
LFVAWQRASETGQEYLDPVRSQYNEFILLVNGLYRGKSVPLRPLMRALVSPSGRSLEQLQVVVQQG